jgi:hypothetical protein
MTKRRLAICLAIAVAIVLVVGLGAGCNPYLGSGTIVVKATLNGVDWPTTGTANVNYRLKLDSPPTNNMQGDTVPHTVQPAPAGDWTCTYISGGPGGVPTISASPSPHLDAGGTITFTLAF